MKLKTVLNKINVTDMVDNFLLANNILGDVGVNTAGGASVVYHIEKTLNLYSEYETLYDEKYTMDWIEYCLIDSIPDMMQCCVKNAVAISKIFSNFKDIQEKNITENVNKNSYQGFNADGVYNRTDALITQNLYNPIRTMLLMNGDFREVTYNFKKNLEKILQLMY